MKVADDQVLSHLEFDSMTDEPRYKFNIICGTEGEVVHENLEVTAIYDSVNLSYKDKDLTQYVKSLKKHKNKTALLDDLNASWKNHYVRNPTAVKSKLFRI